MAASAAAEASREEASSRWPWRPATRSACSRTRKQNQKRASCAVHRQLVSPKHIPRWRCTRAGLPSHMRDIMGHLFPPPPCTHMGECHLLHVTGCQLHPPPPTMHPRARVQPLPHDGPPARTASPPPAADPASPPRRCANRRSAAPERPATQRHFIEALSMKGTLCCSTATCAPHQHQRWELNLP